MPEPIIHVKDIVKQFDKIVAVDHVSFDVMPGEIFAFLGPNGAGKTTTIKMLTTLLNPTSGEMKINGHDVLHEQDAVRHSFGIVFQDQSLDDELTAYENMQIHAELYGMEKNLQKERIEKLLNFVGLGDRKDSFVKTFSGGMKRRLEIARGLVHHPKILFLDEPTLGLDPQTRNHMWDYIKELNKKETMTVFFTTHYMEEASKVANRIAIIDNGKIIKHGTVKELLKAARAKTLEDAFLKLTGHSMREESASSMDAMRMGSKLWRGR